MSFGKNNSSKNTSSQQSQAANQAATPTNLPQLQRGWGLNNDLVNGTSGNQQNIDLVNRGIQLTGQGGNAAEAAAAGGLQTATNLANGGTANAANGYLTPFASGGFTTANPYFAQMINNLTQGLQPQIDGSSAAAGRYGSGANAHAFADSLTREAGTLGYQDYDSAMNRQLQAAGQLSNNNATSTGQSIAALNTIAPLGSTAVGAGAAQVATGQQPLDNYAKILALLGGGGGSQSSTGTGSGTGTENGSSTGFGFDLGKMFSPITLFG